MRLCLLPLLAVLVSVCGCASAGETGPPQFDHSHAILDTLLATYVEGGLVDYSALAMHRGELQDYLDSLGRLDKVEFDSFTRDQRLALLINAYNAFTLELILRNYPVESIRDIEGNWTDQIWSLAGRKLSLNDLENKIIRPDFKEPRIHFALVCAAKGCPPLLPAAYTAARLEEQLSAASQDYARDRRFNRLDPDSATLGVSKLFEWYRDDFIQAWTDVRLPEGGDTSAQYRGIIGFFLDHLDEKEVAFLRSNAVRISYMDYDWSLNDRVSD